VRAQFDGFWIRPFDIAYFAHSFKKNKLQAET